MQLQGTIKKIGDTQTFATVFQKREMILLTQEQYKQPISIDFLQDKCDLLDNVKEGQFATVYINIRGREFTNPQGEVKYFNSIVGWKIENEPTKAEKPEKPINKVKQENPFEDEEDGNSPF
mgnify:CR=1 FL=1